MKKYFLSASLMTLLASNAQAAAGKEYLECRPSGGRLAWVAVTYTISGGQRIKTSTKNMNKSCTAADYEQSRQDAAKFGEKWPSLERQTTDTSNGRPDRSSYGEFADRGFGDRGSRPDVIAHNKVGAGREQGNFGGRGGDFGGRGADFGGRGTGGGQSGGMNRGPDGSPSSFGRQKHPTAAKKHGVNKGATPGGSGRNNFDGGGRVGSGGFRGGYVGPRYGGFRGGGFGPGFGGRMGYMRAPGLRMPMYR
jgi:hypothetical protein